MREYRLLYLTDFWSPAFCNGWTDTLEAAGYCFGARGNELRV